MLFKSKYHLFLVVGDFVGDGQFSNVDICGQNEFPSVFEVACTYLQMFYFCRLCIENNLKVIQNFCSNFERVIIEKKCYF